MSDAINRQVLVGFRIAEAAPAAAQARFENVLRPFLAKEGSFAEFGVKLAGALVTPATESARGSATALFELHDGAVSEFLEKPMSDSVEYCERNSVLRLCAWDDPLFTARNGQWGLRQIGTLETWNTQVDTPGHDPVVIAVVDSGLMWRWSGGQQKEVGAHEDLDGRTGNAPFPLRLWRNPGEPLPPNGTDSDGNSYVDDFNGARIINGRTVAPYGDGQLGDDYGHGTLLAGLMFASAGNALGLASPLTAFWPDIKLMPVKFFDASSRPEPLNAEKAIKYAVDNGASVINLSWHVAGVAQKSGPILNAIAHAKQNGVLVVTAAGNDGSNNDKFPTWPANFSLTFDNVLAVHATDRHDHKPAFSNYGPTSVQLGAPGVRIETTRRYVGRNPGYGSISGTSASAAFASLAAAMVIAREYSTTGAKPTPADVIAHLMATADTFPHLHRCSISSARLNLDAAVNTPM